MSVPPPDPEEVTAAGAPAHAEIAAATRVGAVQLTVSDLAGSIDYYERAIGLSVHERGAEHATLGVGEEDLLVLVEQPGARPARGYCGLYHFALLLPERPDLARWLAHAARDRVPLAGMADHFVSEAIYLSDPDGHGIEIYWDRPREVWEGRVAKRMTTLPLDTPSLFGELADPANEPFDGLPAGTAMGHVHLCVADIPQTIAFYRDVLGFALDGLAGRSGRLSQRRWLPPSPWRQHLGERRRRSAATGSCMLTAATVVLPSEAERDRLASRARGRRI